MSTPSAPPDHDDGPREDQANEASNHNQYSTDDSAAEFDYEPFHTFRFKVLEFGRRIFGNRRIECELLTGGPFNRMIGLRVSNSPLHFTAHIGQCHETSKWFSQSQKPTDKPDEKQYILSMTRCRDRYTLLHDVAVLQFIREKTNIPVPKVIDWDNSDRNELGCEYIVQERLSGWNLADQWCCLTLEQKKSALRDIVRIMMEIQTLKCDRGGVIRPQYPSAKDEFVFTSELDRFDLGKPIFPRWGPEPPSPPQPAFFFMNNLIGRAEYAHWNSPVWDRFDLISEFIPLMIKFKKILNGLRDRGFLLDDHPLHFVHADLFKRNIVVEYSDEACSDDSILSVTGVLNWDAGSAYYVPKFIAFHAPMFLWHSTWRMGKFGVGTPYESLVQQKPVTDDDKELKALFDELASEEWKYYAFSPAYSVGRRIFQWLIKRKQSRREFEEGYDIVRAWEKLFEVDLSEDDDVHH